jgi:alpha-tubulin suppressor-like RCC1 family protein
MPTLDSMIRACSVGIAVVAIGSCGGDSLDGGQTRRALDVTTAGSEPSAVEIAPGRTHTCALTHAGGVKCWGTNSLGQLGDGTAVSRLTPVDVTGLTSGVISIAAGMNHTCVVMSGGGVKCWGENDQGQLGDGTKTNRLTPMDVVGLSSGVLAVTAGDDFTCALTQGGGVKCWGTNFMYGQLGDGTKTNRLTPVDVVGLSSGVTAIAAGFFHTCALTGAGGVKCWGRNNEGELGEPLAGSASVVPIDVSGLSSGMLAVAGGGYHSCALTTDGSAKCWGLNRHGQLGDGTTQIRYTPADVIGLSGGRSISAGDERTCALTNTGAVKCWGVNVNGQLGDGTTTDRLTPVTVVGLSSGTARLVTGPWHTCALTNGGAAKCWGWNIGGQLGDGTTTDRMTPVAVIGFTANVATNLENPAPGAPVSGIGLVSGWTCISGVVEVSFNGGPRDNLVPSGGGRGDTLPVCGRTNTGFGLLFNYNLLGSGNHTVELFINGVQVGAPVPFTVTVPTGEFIKGASKTVDAFDFPTVGKTTRLEWQESTQNFAITGVR